MERNLLRASSLRLRQWERLHAVPSKGAATSGRNKARVQEKRRTDELARERVHVSKSPELEGGLILMSGHTADLGEDAPHSDCAGSYVRWCSGWGCLWSEIYMDIINSMPKIQQLQTTTTKTQNICLKGTITHNIRLSYMAGPVGLQNPSLLWAGKATRRAF